MNNKIVLSIIAGVIVVAGAVALLMPQKNGGGPVNNNPPVAADPGIEVFAPKAYEVVSSPLNITGIVKGFGWTGFEGQVGIVKLFDSSDKELGMGILTATEEWMKPTINFGTTLFFDYPGDGTGKLVFYNENASGEPARDKTYTLPVKLSKSSGEKMKVKAYFNNKLTPASCEAVLYSEREIPKTLAVARAALDQLLLGPTDLEKTAGFSTSINTGVKVQSLAIADGVAKVDFSKQLQEGVAGSCKVTAIRSQITQTLKQFPTVKSVIISIDGKTEGILQP